MKTIKLLIVILLLGGTSVHAQSWLKKLGKKVEEVAKETVEKKVEQKTEEAVDKTIDKVTDAETYKDDEEKEEKSKKKKKEKKDVTNEERNTSENNQPSTKQKLESYGQYDFVTGDKLLYFEDFSQDAIGDFPSFWTSNSGGEVKTVNIAQGHWFHMNGTDAAYCYTQNIAFPENFIVEFDIIPDAEYADGMQFTLYRDHPDDVKDLNDDLYPGAEGLHVRVMSDRWETKGYKDNLDWITGSSVKKTVIQEQVNHVIVWIQKRRVRIYHQGVKVLDVPTNIHEGCVFNRFRFDTWDSGAFPFITNLKITSASPDTRSKLITEGKLVTYGITFDTNKADIKNESYATLKSIADVLKENTDVKIKIVGHTDGDGNNASNLDLSNRRAVSVKNELIKNFGIDASRIVTEGAGESKPIVPNDTPTNKAQNRRVEFVKV